MKIFNTEQKKSLAKYCYDLSKVSIGVFLFIPITKYSYETKFLVTGLIIASILLLVGYFFERGLK